MSPTPPGTTESSSPRPPHERQQELLQEIGRDLIGGCPQGWSRIDLSASVALTQDLMSLVVLMPDHSSPSADLPLSVGRALRELRELMYTDERGTWFSLRYTMDPPAAFHVVYNYDFDPKWYPDLSPHEWARDLERFPRAPEHVPDWLRAKLPEDDQTTAGY
ncbi:hypothetical protein G7043_41840 [Lentzea sp. NEAU-D13]|uniref:Uncharacterized protein n=1 Tax=Lentzea alba TaxID=2714351 RepID=A0A7C9VYU0_9PSEU|nr:hypothetical protein [Lentzea alba]NGY65455.1 hypothetical protein [Lentzea alba]